MILWQHKFHSPQCYDLGPYATAKDYTLANYDKEAYYYAHQPEDETDWLAFEKHKELYQDLDNDEIPDVHKREELLNNKARFVDELKNARAALAASEDFFTPEPFVLCHGDLQGRNMIVRDGHIAGMSDLLPRNAIKTETATRQGSSTGNSPTLYLL